MAKVSTLPSNTAEQILGTHNNPISPHIPNDIILGTNADNIRVNLADSGIFTSNNPTAMSPAPPSLEALDIRDLISGHGTNENAGGSLHFSVNNGVAILGIDFYNSSGDTNPTYVQVATIEGVSGMSGSQILNSLLAHHDIKFD